MSRTDGASERRDRDSRIQLRGGEEKGYADISEIKRRVENNEIDLAPLVMRLGWAKEEDTIVVVERADGCETEDQGKAEFGAT